MRPLSGLFLLTFRELWSKKVILGLFLVSSLVLLMVGFALNLDVVEGSLEGLRFFGQDAGPDSPDEGGLPSLTEVVVGVESIVAGATYWLGILLALFASASLFPNLQTVGRVELLLSKPISRMQVIVGHVLGVWVVIAALTVYLMGGTWLIMSIKSGVWTPRFLLSIILVVGMFAVMYAAVMLMGVWTKSTALALIVSYGLIFASMVLAGGDSIGSLLGPVGTPIFWGLYHVLPNFTEVTQIVVQLAQKTEISSWYPVWSSLLFGAGAYLFAGFWFIRRDF